MMFTYFDRLDFEGGSLHFLPDAKFKTVSIRLLLSVPLKKEDAASTALLPFVWKRGTKCHPDLSSIGRFFEDLYGASFSCALGRGGERQLLSFNLDLPSDRFLPPLPGGEKILARGLGFFKELLTEPLTEGNRFRKDYFLQEKTNLRRFVEGLLDDKITFAFERCIQEMCKEEPFGVYPYGDPDSIDSIQNEPLFTRSQEVLRSASLDLFVVGPLDRDVVTEEFHTLVSALGPRPSTEVKSATFCPPGTPRHVIEEFPVNQGKLVLGYRANLDISDSVFDGLVLFSALFGGGPTSRLFRKVREEKSLAYYASASLEKKKGLLFVQAGINPENFDSILETIGSEFQSLSQGKISGQELADTKRFLNDRYRSILDSSRGLIGFAEEGELTGRRRSLEEVLQGIEKTSIPEIVEAADGVKLDTIYFLKPEHESHR